jgi:two-component system sensor histidine kinase YesM
MENNSHFKKYAFLLIISISVIIFLSTLTGILAINGFQRKSPYFFVFFTEMASILSLICALFILIKIIIPLYRSIKIFNEIKNVTLLENSGGGQDLKRSIRKLGIMNMLIEEMAQGISKEPKARMLGAEVALYALQSQINPHFLYNTLDTIRNYAMKYNVPEVAEMTQSMSSIFRYSISRLGEVASLADEINNIKAYLKIQWYRFGDRFRVVWDIDEENDEIMKYSLPVLTLQPLVENALQHGLENNLETGLITIRATSTQSKLIVSIEDNGSGIPADKLNEIREKMNSDSYTDEGKYKKATGERKTGISLANVKQRLKLYFGDEGNLSINSIEGFGTTIEIEVPKIR